MCCPACEAEVLEVATCVVNEAATIDCSNLSCGLVSNDDFPTVCQEDYGLSDLGVPSGDGLLGCYAANLFDCAFCAANILPGSFAFDYGQSTTCQDKQMASQICPIVECCSSCKSEALVVADCVAAANAQYDCSVLSCGDDSGEDDGSDNGAADDGESNEGNANDGGSDGDPSIDSNPIDTIFPNSCLDAFGLTIDGDSSGSGLLKCLATNFLEFAACPSRLQMDDFLFDYGNNGEKCGDGLAEETCPMIDCCFECREQTRKVVDCVREAKDPVGLCTTTPECPGDGQMGTIAPSPTAPSPPSNPSIAGPANLFGFPFEVQQLCAFSLASYASCIVAEGCQERCSDKDFPNTNVLNTLTCTEIEGQLCSFVDCCMACGDRITNMFECATKADISRNDCTNLCPLALAPTPSPTVTFNPFDFPLSIQEACTLVTASFISCVLVEECDQKCFTDNLPNPQDLSEATCGQIDADICPFATGCCAACEPQIVDIYGCAIKSEANTECPDLCTSTPSPLRGSFVPTDIQVLGPRDSTNVGGLSSSTAKALASWQLVLVLSTLIVPAMVFLIL